MECQRVVGLRTKLIAGSLSALLAAAAVASAFAVSATPNRPTVARGHEQNVGAARKKGGKSKTITKTFSSEAAIAIPAAGSTDRISAGDPYPSTIAVKGFKKARVRDVNLTLHDFSHQFPLDVDIMLVSPGGRNALVMSDVGGNLPGDEAAVSGLALTLDDEADESLPVDARLTSGTFRPVEDEDADDFPAPAPAPSGRIALSTLDGINPNGQWRLFVVDDSAETDDGDSRSRPRARSKVRANVESGINR
jgi:hypothetical protein